MTGLGKPPGHTWCSAFGYVIGFPYHPSWASPLVLRVIVGQLSLISIGGW